MAPLEGETLDQALARLGLPRYFDGLTIVRRIVSSSIENPRRVGTT